MNAVAGIRNLESRAFAQLTRDGFYVLKGFFPVEECRILAAELSAYLAQNQYVARGKLGGVRNLLWDEPAVAQLANSPGLISMLGEAIEGKVFAVRAIFFDKTAEANWLVPWHQDIAIAVSERIETTGFSGWSVKDGVTHVLPPQEILKDMVAVRLHLDDCDAENGALKMIPGSHSRGRLTAAQIAECASEKAHVCELSRGDVLLMRPLLLHASSPASNPTHRRVLQIEYASTELPNGLKWFGRQ